MYPTLLKFGSFEITTFGLMMFLAFIIGGWVLTRQFRRYGLSDDAASSIVMAAALGGIAGAKIYYAILFHDWHLLLDRAGLVWYGGLIGGFLGCSGYILAKRLDYFTVADAAAPALAIAIIVYAAYWLGQIIKHRAYNVVPRIQVAELAARLAAGGTDKIKIVDVRSHGYYDVGAERIHGSIRIEPSNLDEEIKNLPKDAEFYLYCT